MQKQLELTIRINDEHFDVDVYEPESGTGGHFQFPYSPDEHPEFNQAIGNEIYSWLELWKDEMEDIKDVWDEFGDVPMNPDTERIEVAWREFPAGTHREEIWHWFEETFHISVHDLMYT